jgi:hypothetical protein
MANAAILMGGIVIRTTGFTDTVYNTFSGFLSKFKWKDKVYRYCRNTDFKYIDEDKREATGGYYEEDKFLEYLAGRVNKEDLSKYELDFSKIEYVKNDDLIFSRKLKIETPFTKFCFTNEYKWIYNPTDIILDDNLNVKIPVRATIEELEHPVSGVAKAFYDQAIATVLTLPVALQASCAYVVSSTAIKIDRIRQDIFSILNSDEQFNLYIQNQEYEWANAKLFSNPSPEIYASYYANLTSFYHNAYSNQLYLKQAKKGEKLYYLAHILPPSGLSVIPAYDKIDLLRTIAIGPILGAISGVAGAVNEEELVIKIVQSVPDNQISAFLNGLLSNHIIEGDDQKTLFEVLYRNVDDAGIGAENMTAFVKELYKLWFKSDYNPYNIDGSVKGNLASITNYQAKPTKLDYQSESFLWIFNSSNYDFRFNKSKINIVEPVTSMSGDVPTTDYNLIGSYGIYQTLVIAHKSTSTSEISFAALEIDGVQNDALPLFYLKFLDDKMATENLKTSLKIGLDLALTFSGVGNLSKLKYLRYLTPLGRRALAAGGEELIAYELYRGTAALVEISASTADILLNYAINYENTYCKLGGPKYNLDKCQFYRRLADFSFCLQLVSGIVDYHYTRKLEEGAARLLEGPIPNDLHPDVLNLIKKFAGNIDTLKLAFRERCKSIFDDYNSEIWRKINNAGSEGEITLTQRDELLNYLDSSSDDYIKEINNGELIDHWFKIQDLKPMRKDINYLVKYKEITNNVELQTHVHNGDSKLTYEFEPDGITYKPTAANVSGYHNADKIMPPPPKPGEISWKGPVKNSNPGSPNLGYTLGTIQRNMADKIDKATGLPWKVFNSRPPNHLKVKKAQNVFWPSAYTQDRINEEMALVLHNFDIKSENPVNGINGVKAYIYQGRASDGHVIEVLFANGNYKNGKLETIYPTYF